MNDHRLSFGFAATPTRAAQEEGQDLSEYFGALKDNPILKGLEAESRRIREMSRQRI